MKRQIEINGQRLNRLREEAGVSESRLTSEVEISRRRIRDIVRSPRVSILRTNAVAIAKLLGIGIEQFTAPSMTEGRARNLIDELGTLIRNGQQQKASLLLNHHSAEFLRQPIPHGELPFFDEQNRLKGKAPFQEVHHERLRHRTVLLAVSPSPGHVLLYERPFGQLCAGLEDGFGGHMETNDQTAIDNAIREASTEIIVKCGDQYVALERDWFTQIGKVGQFDYNSDANREFSTLFVVKLPDLRGLWPEARGELELHDDLVDGTIATIRHTSKVHLEDLFAGSRDRSQMVDGLFRWVEKLSLRKHSRLKDQLFRQVMCENR